MKKKFFTPRKHQIQASPAFVAKKRRSMDFQESLMTPKAEPCSERKQSTNCTPIMRKLDFSDSDPKTPKSVENNSDSSEVKNSPIYCNLIPDVPPPLPPKPTPKAGPKPTPRRATPRRQSLKPRRTSMNNSRVFQSTHQKENGSRNYSTQSLPVTKRSLGKANVQSLIAKYEACAAKALKSPAIESDCEYVSLSKIPVSVSRKSLKTCTPRAKKRSTFDSQSLISGPHTAL